MKKSGLRPSLSPWSLLSRMLRLICLSFCFLLAGDPAVADTSAPSSTRGVYVPAPNVQVSDFRQRMLSEAQKAATGAHLRLQVSGEAPVDPSKAVVVDQKPGPNTMVPAGTTVTVVANWSIAVPLPKFATMTCPDGSPSSSRRSITVDGSV